MGPVPPELPLGTAAVLALAPSVRSVDDNRASPVETGCESLAETGIAVDVGESGKYLADIADMPEPAAQVQLFGAIAASKRRRPLSPT